MWRRQRSECVCLYMIQKYNIYLCIYSSFVSYSTHNLKIKFDTLSVVVDKWWEWDPKYRTLHCATLNTRSFKFRSATKNNNNTIACERSLTQCRVDNLKFQYFVNWKKRTISCLKKKLNVGARVNEWVNECVWVYVLVCLLSVH